MLADGPHFRHDAHVSADLEELLGDLQGEEREARRRLLARLREDGIPEAELRAAVAEERLVLLPVERVLGGRLTAREIEAETGLPAGVLLRFRRFEGLPEAQPDDRVFGEDDIAAARATREFMEAGLGEEAIVSITRVLGESMARLSDTVAAAFVETFLEPGQTEEELALRFAELAEQLAPAFGPVLNASYLAHLRDSVRRGMLGRTERETGARASQLTTVCFADLVGFTRLGWRVDPTELGQVAGRLAELAADVAEPPVRLVKTIGDAAMLVSREPKAVVGAALSLVQAAEAEGLPALRAGVACGQALQRGGDFYGNTVNVASRVTGQARPGTVLATQEVRDAAGEAFTWSFAGKHRLRGVSEPLPLHRARERAPDADAS